ncbi:MAG: zinc ABC transporter solute-binding protein, partial [Saprospiraceae bacterium]|nr:zinc ABC transporter solute-binding protein [Saprospiraceae bacterium]
MKSIIGRFIFLSYFITAGLTLAAQKPKVVCSASMIWDITKNIAGDHVEHGLIVPIGGDPHLYEPTPADAQLVYEADLIFINGLTFEGWILELIANSGTKAITDTVTSGIVPISSSKYKDSFDPHAWMDVKNGQIYARNIKDALISLLPDKADEFNANFQTYTKKLKELDDYIIKRISEIPEEKRVLITSHDAFEYYGKRYGLRLEAMMGISTESEAQTSDMIRISKTIKETGIPAIFIESTINPKLIQQVAKDNSVMIGGELYADSIGDEDSHGNSYINMLKHNTDVIVDALSHEINPDNLNKSESGSLWP